MSDTNTQAVGNTQATDSAQTAAAAATETATIAGAAAATTSQQANESQPAASATTDSAASTEGDAATTEKPAGAPEKYEFKAPEGGALDATVMAEFSTVAKELGLSQDAAQKVIDKLAPTIVKQNAEAITQAMETASTEWVKATQTDKDIGGAKLGENLAVAKKALDAFGTPELRALLGRYDPKDNPKGTGLGNHPEIIKAFFKAGKAISEDKFVPGGKAPSKGETNAAKSLYPNQPA